MKSQSYETHRRLLPSYHFITLAAILLVTGGAINNFIHALNGEGNVYDAALILVIGLILISLFFHSRMFALRAQDRAIRAEENLRHLVLTGKMLDPKVTVHQVVALRFAPDEEFAALAQRAASEGLTADQIKKEIKQWKADHHRA